MENSIGLKRVKIGGNLLEFISTYQTSDMLVKTPSFSDSGAIHLTGNNPLLPFL